MDSEARMHDLLESMLRDPSVEPTNLPLALLKAITNNFSDDQKIGSGGFSVVYKVSVLSSFLSLGHSCSIRVNTNSSSC
jgi:hypothetical protein